MRTAVIIPVLNQFILTNQTLRYLSQEEPRPFDLIVLDNASDSEFKTSFPDVDIVRSDIKFGPYQSFWNGLNVSDSDILAFFHSDLFVYDKDWWRKVENEFDKNPKLGLIGFVGSNEIDGSGGRGLGTVSNFQGKRTIRTMGFQGDQRQIQYWEGSPAEVHGKRTSGFIKAAVVDGCAMIFRREVLEKIRFRENFPPHHFYDRLLSCEVQELGYEVGVLGVEFDHISGQTANQEQSYQDFAREWATKHRITPGGLGTNWDTILYQEAEKQWLTEYRDQKHFIPRKV